MRLLPEYTSDLRAYVIAICGLFLLVAAAGTVALKAQIRDKRVTMQALLPSGSPPDHAANVAELSRQVYRLIVETDGAIKIGTGFLVSGRRVIATNNHVVEKGKRFALGYLGERGAIRRVGLKLLALFPQKDLALLEAFDDLPGEALPLATDYPELASDLFAIGFPAAADFAVDVSTQATDQNFFLPSVLKGNVSRIMSGVWITNQLQHQTPISAGYSGGPLVDNRGIVVGVNTAINKEANGISYGVTAPDLARLLNACALPLRAVHLQRHAAIAAPETIAVMHPAPSAQSSGSDTFFLKRAYEALWRGDIASARATFEYLTRKSGESVAFEGLAKTYDPQVLKRLRVIGDLADAAKAKELYDMARRPAGEPMAALAPPAEESATRPRPVYTSSSDCNESLCVMLESADGSPNVICRRGKPAATVQ